MQSFNKIQQLLSKTNGKVVGDLMTTVPLAVREATNLEDAVRYLPLYFDPVVNCRLLAFYTRS